MKPQSQFRVFMRIPHDYSFNKLHTASLNLLHNYGSSWLLWQSKILSDTLKISFLINDFKGISHLEISIISEHLFKCSIFFASWIAQMKNFLDKIFNIQPMELARLEHFMEHFCGTPKQNEKSPSEALSSSFVNFYFRYNGQIKTNEISL